MKMLMLLLIAELGLVVGCGHCPDAVTKATPPVAGQTTALRDTQVLAIARLAVATNDTWLDRAEFETPRRQADGSWSVLVWRLPKVPGGHRVINMNDKGQVMSYFRGS
jgi:hypothetical protein